MRSTHPAAGSSAAPLPTRHDEGGTGVADAPTAGLRGRRATALMLLAAATTVVLWASSFVAVRAAGYDFAPGALALGRLVVGAAVLTVFVAVRAARQRRLPAMPGRRDLLAIAAWGAAWFGAYSICLNAAEQVLDAGTASLLVNIAPLIVAVVAGLLLGEGFPRTLLIGIAIAFVGSALIAVSTWTGQGSLVGVALGFAAALLYAGGAAGQKPLLARVDALTMTWLGCLVGVLVCAPWKGELIATVQSAPLASTLAVAYLGVGPTAIAFVTWGYVLARASAGRVTASTYAVPPLVVLISWLLLDEVPGPLGLIGGACCLVGVAVATLLSARSARRTGARRGTPAA